MTDKLNLIKERLQNAFSPVLLEVMDESDQHIGHAGHQGGGRHFAIVIAAHGLDDLPRVEAHQQIYALFNDLMPEQIHAFKITVRKSMAL